MPKNVMCEIHNVFRELPIKYAYSCITYLKSINVSHIIVQILKKLNLHLKFKTCPLKTFNYDKC